MKQLTPTSYIATLLIIAVVQLALSCAKKDSFAPADSPTGQAKPSPLTLLNQDFAAFETTPSSGAAIIDTNHDGLYTKIFGGTDGISHQHYLNQRLRKYLSQEDLSHATLTPTNFIYTKWSDVPDQDKKMKDAGAEVAASNVGTGIFLQGWIDDTNITLNLENESTPVTSSRVGLMLIGPGYKEKMDSSRGEQIVLPPAYRQSILIHEARHSDCSSQLGPKEREIARKATDYIDFQKSMKDLGCGHLHSVCPEGHAFAGIAACDDHAWGAYTVAAIFLVGQSTNAEGTDHQILDAMAADSLERFQGGTITGLVNGAYGNPNMKSYNLKTGKEE